MWTMSYLASAHRWGDKSRDTWNEIQWNKSKATGIHVKIWESRDGGHRSSHMPKMSPVKQETAWPSESGVSGVSQQCDFKLHHSFASAFSFVVVVQSLSPVWLLGTPWTAAHQPPLSFTISRTEFVQTHNLPAVQETWVQFLGQKDPLEKEMATHYSILAWRIPWTEEFGRLQSMGSQASDTT